MDLIKYEMEIPKESKEVIDLLDALLEQLLSEEKDYAKVLPALMSALDGMAGIKDEVKASYKDELAAYLVHKVLGRLLK